MKILFIGDIVGKPGRMAVKEILPKLKSENDISLTIANGENLAGGIGITPSVAQEIKSYGVDVITTGNHVWRRKEIEPFLNIAGYLLRPENYPPGNPGKG
ncbi:MAG: YmdB family metallophosphoesterase, partial [Actinobacteria bacterium]|nr:YmdB family metallophosphoesterase [Actinomycetota bacterium]